MDTAHQHPALCLALHRKSKKLTLNNQNQQEKNGEIRFQNDTFIVTKQRTQAPVNIKILYYVMANTGPVCSEHRQMIFNLNL